MVNNIIKQNINKNSININEINDNELIAEKSSDDSGMENEAGEDKSMEVKKTEDSSSPVKHLKKPRKKGIIYVTNIPKHMNVTRIREILGQYGNIGRVYLQPEAVTDTEAKKKKKRKRYTRHFTEGWVEFERKRVAKQVAEMLNNKQIASRKRSQFYDYLWSIKYLPRFKWVHLSERLNYEKAVHKQRLMAEISQARKEANFFQSNLDKSDLLQKTSRKNKIKESKQ